MQKNEQKKLFQEALVSWYYREKRDLPWRKTTDPYLIWVSEVMLQQTRVETVIPYYERFTAKFPTMQALANAKEEELLKMWEGLGYYSRARNLQQGVKEVVESYGGSVPTTRKEISSLRGVGPYTAGAILSIAFGIPEHAVDGNVMRVLSRILLIEEDIALPRTRKTFEQAVMDLIYREDPSAFNQALMELGATICIPRPKCLLCPVREYCAAFEEGRQDELPVKTKKTKMKIVPLAVFAISDGNGKWFMQQRPEKGLLANMWEFPTVELLQEENTALAIKDQYGLQLDEVSAIFDFNHVFSHLTWEVKGYVAVTSDAGSISEKARWFTAEEIEALPKPIPVIKLWDVVSQN
ncbi:A/G-specific adenine glycosylase [Sporosarcina cyprini]|uniref:A/G-specific adenine glycosylase n=1 Tax=Sporosarcina cyprini TaxID=2910523 RepID=UPI001EDD3778|nr:A/G-specific adenine glycosylase [Sporosarcina cyprini]MCG3086926.1 A/G-specific adenine glycosylase [Sporosarcina cyprini]